MFIRGLREYWFRYVVGFNYSTFFFGIVNYSTFTTAITFSF
jgi:hypothetical protein